MLQLSSAFSQNVRKIFSELKLVADNCSLFMQQPTEKPLTLLLHHNWIENLEPWMVVDWHGNICRGLSRTCPAPASWGRETSAPRTPCESGRRSTWVRREEGSWWILETNVRVSIIHPSLMVSSILRASFRYCFSACVTNSNIISLTPPPPTHTHTHVICDVCCYK